jgi:hypothetical protein
MHKRKSSSEVYPHTGKRQIHAAPDEQSEDTPHVEAPGSSLAPPTYTTAFAIPTESSFPPHRFPTAVDISNHYSEPPATESSPSSVNEASKVSHKTSVVNLGPLRSKVLKFRNRLEQAKGASSGTTWPNPISDTISPYITTHSVRNNVQGHSADHLLENDLPHSLKNGMNTVATSIPNPPRSRFIFESRTKEGDVDAPPIIVYDDNDDAITTHFDFRYTDKVWHGEGVPVSNLKLLQGCDCDGVCDPRSKECRCVARQSKHVPGRTGFIYNKMGQLIEKLHYPIFECNTFCACGEKCKNRASSLINLLESIDTDMSSQVVQQGRKCMVNLVRTQDTGLGESNYIEIAWWVDVAFCVCRCIFRLPNHPSRDLRRHILGGASHRLYSQMSYFVSVRFSFFRGPSLLNLSHVTAGRISSH